VDKRARAFQAEHFRHIVYEPAFDFAEKVIAEQDKKLGF
jgi:hypothetical protein